jgi:hypothetical protein
MREHLQMKLPGPYAQDRNGRQGEEPDKEGLNPGAPFGATVVSAREHEEGQLHHCESHSGEKAQIHQIAPKTKGFVIL